MKLAFPWGEWEQGECSLVLFALLKFAEYNSENDRNKSLS